MASEPTSNFSSASTTLILPSDRATLVLGQWLGRHLPAGSVLLLKGELGSGKTTLTKGLGLGLGVAEEVDSPTFTLINEYEGDRLPLYHIDLYRLERTETDHLFLESYWEGIEYAPGIVVIEWAERLHYLPPAPLEVKLVYRQSGGREAMLMPSNSTQATLLEALTPDAILAHEI